MLTLNIIDAVGYRIQKAFRSEMFKLIRKVPGILVARARAHNKGWQSGNALDALKIKLLRDRFEIQWAFGPHGFKSLPRRHFTSKL